MCPKSNSADLRVLPKLRIKQHLTSARMQERQAIKQIFDALQLTTDWTSLDTIDSNISYILDNQKLLVDNIPKRVIGNLTLLQSDVNLHRRKCVMSLCRRLASRLEQGIVRRRQQIRVRKKTISKYSYKIIQA